jgi:hypothetical protein
MTITPQKEGSIDAADVTKGFGNRQLAWHDILV